MPERPAAPRVESVDLLRGLVMVLMALDHTRDYFGTADNPTDVAHASAALFATRWITHLCAPTFFLLTGVGAGLAQATRSRAELARYLVVRGLVLVALEVTLLRIFAYQYNADYRVTMLIVIWALGWAMVFLGLMLAFPTWVIGAVGGALIVGHNVFDGVRATNALVAILHGPGFVVQREGFTVFAAYPLVPWIGVTAVGYTLAGIFRWEPTRRQKFLLNAGIAATVLFVALRALNVYGDPSRWTAQATTLRTIASFINTTKYPPSLLYLLMTLGPAMLILRRLETAPPAWTRPLLEYGRAPFFYFFAHFTLIHAAATVTCFAINGSAHWMFESPDLGSYPFTRPPGWGFPLPIVWSVWIAVVVALYPACRWMARLKATRRYPWLSYL